MVASTSETHQIGCRTKMKRRRQPHPRCTLYVCCGKFSELAVSHDEKIGRSYRQEVERGKECTSHVKVGAPHITAEANLHTEVQLRVVQQWKQLGVTLCQRESWVESGTRIEMSRG